MLYSTNRQDSFRYLVQSPQSGMALSHRLFWVLHRVQALLAINARRSVLILATDSSRTAELSAEGMCGDRRDLEGLNAFVSAGGPRRRRAAGAGYAES
jgi:hypothetical protein